MEEDLQKHIDSSDQDPNAIYEDLNDDDFKTHSSGENNVRKPKGRES